MNDTTTVVAEAPAQASKPEVNPLLGKPAGWLVEKFVALRDKKEAIQKEHKEQLDPYNKALGQIEAALMDALNKAGADNMKTPGGTFFKTTRVSATVTRWSETLDYIREKEAWELLEARVSTTAAEAIIQETQAPIPGVTVKRDARLNVRRA